MQLHRYYGAGAGSSVAGVSSRKITHGGEGRGQSAILNGKHDALVTLTAQPDWMGRARCASATPAQADAIFFADGFYSEAKLHPLAAKLCGRCPVRAQCADYAISSETNVVGVWGGMTPAELRQARLTRESQAA